MQTNINHITNYKLILLFFVSVFPTLSLAEPLPVDAFAKLPDVRGLALSPDGTKIANMVRIDVPEFEGTAIFVYDVEENVNRPLVRNDDKEYTLSDFVWGNNDTLLISALYPDNRYGTPTTETRLLKLDIHSGELDGVITRRYYRRYNWIPQFQNNIVDLLSDDSDNILLGLDTDTAGEDRVYKVNIQNGKQEIVQHDRKDVRSWLTDRQHRVRVGFHRDETTVKILVKDITSDDWSTRWEYEVFSDQAITPIGFDHDPNLLYVRKYHDGREAIFSVDLRKPDTEMTLIHADPNYDVGGGLIYSSVKQQVVGITYSEDGGFTFWDEEYLAFQRGLDRALPDTENYIYDMSNDERRYLVLATSDVDSGTYYFGDRDQKMLIPIAKRYGKLTPDIMRPKKTAYYKARDGLEIQAFLTLPDDNEDVAHPTIIFPHGGPISYDDGGFDYWTQFFANRGYAVLQMNFRGSSGYGYDFMQAGLQNWGEEMQNDVEDGTRWLIEQGIADKERMCIVGASYGGYAALMAAVRNPDLYRCVISFAGIGDVVDLVRSYRRYQNYEVVKKQVGEDFSELRENSPVEYGEQFQAPVLLIHGTEDRSVKVQQSREMNRALEKANKKVTYLELEDGNHYLGNSEHRLQTFQAMDDFLRLHLPVN